MPAYLKLGDIKGESKSSQATGKLGSGGTKPSYLKYKLEKVVVTSYSISGSSATAPGSTKFGAGGRGTLEFNRPVSSKTSPFRDIATSSGRLTSLTLVDSSPRLGPVGTCTFTLSGVKVADVATKSDVVPTETISMGYEKIEWTYAEIKTGYTEVEWTY
ncbi:hypothetical protein [Marivita sp.]|uniref:hypothetical protein n=1 Tax=Marivita sp. TaxID=2003365 RepID=UPI003F6C1CA2